MTKFWHDMYCIIFAEGLAWDWINDKLYWTDATMDEIVVYDVNRRYKAILFNTGLSYPAVIVVDPTTRYGLNQITSLL